MLITITSINKLEIHQMKIKIVFLNCDFDKEVYMEQPKRFVIKEQGKKVYKLV